MERTAFRLAWLLLALVVALALAPAAFAKDDKPKPARKDDATLLVRFAEPAGADAKVEAAGDRVAGRIATVHIVRVPPGRTVEERLAAYRARTDVVYAEPNYIASIDVSPPNDPSYSSQWGLGAIKALAGWTLYPGAFGLTSGATIAIADTGVDAAHPDLAGNVLTSLGANCLAGVCSASTAADDQGHGTHVAGIAAALTNNSVGVAGVAISSRTIPVKVLGSDGSGSYASVASGILWAKDRGARVINLSLGGYGYSQTVCDAVTAATAAGSLVVAAAGNDGTSVPHYPSACPGAIGIAATDSSDGSPDWSNWSNPNVFISGPGVGIYSTYWSSGSTYATLSGTSMATPHVAGLAALLFGQVSTRTPTDVKRILAQSASKVGADRYPPLTYGSDPYGTCSGCTWHPYYGYGLIDDQAALSVFTPPPTIGGISPSSGPSGTVVTITGANFSGVTSVTLAYQVASYTVVSPTEIRATVPAGAASGRWRVTTGAGTAASGVFTVTGGPPAIASISPGSGPVGTTVTITGTNFTGATAVTLAYKTASFTVDSSTKITATVPAGASSGRWRVTTGLGTAASAVFTVTTSLPTIAGISPASGPVGTTVTITGSNFSGVTAVTLAYKAASYTVESPTRITATVPAGAGSGRWRVTTPAGTAASAVFTVT